MSESSAATPETTEIHLFKSAEAAAAAPSGPVAPTPPLPLPLRDAVRDCLAAYNRALAAERASGAAQVEAEQKAAAAYRDHMPVLTSRGNVQAFIACVAWGIVHRTFQYDEGPRFLAAARTALSALPRDLRPVGRPAAADTVPEK
jgi:hypothetical protein